MVKVDSLSNLSSSSATSAGPGDDFVLARIASGEQYVDVDDVAFVDGEEEEELGRVSSRRLHANTVRGSSPEPAPRARSPSPQPPPPLHPASSSLLEVSSKMHLPGPASPEPRSVTSQDESWFDRLPATGWRGSGAEEEEKEEKEEEEEEERACEAGRTDAHVERAEGNADEDEDAGEASGAGAGTDTPLLESAVPSASSWAAAAAGGAGDAERRRASLMGASATMSLTWNEEEEAEGDSEEETVGGTRLVAVASGILGRCVRLLWPEGAPVRPVEPLTRKMLWKMTGGADAGVAEPLDFRDNEEQAAMWRRLLLSLRRHPRHVWGPQLADPLLRRTFVDQHAMRARPTTASNTVCMAALLAAGLVHHAAALLCHLSAAAFAQRSATRAAESCGEGETAGSRAGAGAAAAGAGPSAAHALFLSLIPVLAGLLAGWAVAASTGRVLLRLRVNNRRLGAWAALVSGALHLHLVSRVGLAGEARRPALVAAVVMVLAADLQRRSQAAAQAAVACAVWGLQALLSAHYAGAALVGAVAGAVLLAAHHLDLILVEHFRKVVLVEHEISMTLGICRNLLPGHVIDHMVWSNGKSSPCDRFEEVTILFADIVGFTSMSAKLSAQQLVDLLNNIFSLFDRMAVKNKVYKVETIGDCYFCATGIPYKDPEHADNMLKMALDMLETTRDLTTPAGEKIQFRIGVHSGSTVAGVMGDKMPRYHLFGQSVRAANELEQGGKPSKIHISDTTRRRLSPSMLSLMQGSDPVVFCEAARRESC